MSEYVTILVRRAKRWEQFLGKNCDLSKLKLKKSAKLERFVHKGIPMSLRGSVWMVISGAKAKRDKDPKLYDKMLTKRVKSKDVTIEQINTDIPRPRRYFLTPSLLPPPTSQHPVERLLSTSQ